MLRELCYDQDLFILQIALMILDPNSVFVSILDRFQLTQYFSGTVSHPSYEGAHLSSMVEEVLYVFITIVSEEANANKMPLPSQVRREIVHALAMGSCTYTDLTKRVAERMVEDVCFERVLAEAASFRPPESTSDSGIYELKDEAYDEINPFYFHYTRNRREEVETVLKNRLKKQTGISDPVIVPKSWNCNHGPFANLVSVFESDVLLQIMFYAVHNILVLTDSFGEAPPSAEAILDQGLHLIMLALVNHGTAFSQLALIKQFEQLTLIDDICTLEHHEKFKSYKPRAEWILTQFARHIPQEVNKRRRASDVNGTQGPDPDDTKKKAAKARQEAIMKQMKAQQASFAINFNDTDDDDDEDMTGDADTPVSYGTCIVCQEELNDSKDFGALGLLQPSRLIRRHPDGHNLYLNESLSASISLDRPCEDSSFDSTFPPRDADTKDASFRLSFSFQGFPKQHTRFGLHCGVCTHMMHLDCFHVYHLSIRQRHRAQATRNPPENIARKEFICPLCKSLGNIVIPVSQPSNVSLSPVGFADWIRAAGISILKSKPDQFLDSLHSRTGTGEFVFWSAQDSGYANLTRNPDRSENPDMVKMVDTVMSISKSFSQQTRHLRDRPEPDNGERGAGMYLPEELIGYTISALEIAQRGCGSPGTIVADSVTDPQLRMIRGLVACMTKIVDLQFKGKLDEGKEAGRQAIIKRLLPEWSRTSLTTSSFSHPLLLRDPFTILVETATVAPEILHHVLVLTYYACLARTAIGLIYVLTKTRSSQTVQSFGRTHKDLFGDVRVFFMSVVRHSPVFEHAAEMAFQAFGEPRIEKLLYSFTLPFLRRASILCRAILPSSFPTPKLPEDFCEYKRLLKALDIPALSDLPNQDTLQNALSGWCAHYGQSRAASQMNCGVSLDFPAIYRTARLPVTLDNLFVEQERALQCGRCQSTPIDAAICMICGTVCCMQSHCCTDRENGDRGECNMHTREYVTQTLDFDLICLYAFQMWWGDWDILPR
jgi:E3 ubiquitin-protein ligase UBR1